MGREGSINIRRYQHNITAAVVAAGFTKERSLKQKRQQERFIRKEK